MKACVAERVAVLQQSFRMSSIRDVKGGAVNRKPQGMHGGMIPCPLQDWWAVAEDRGVSSNQQTSRCHNLQRMRSVKHDFVAPPKRRILVFPSFAPLAKHWK